MTSAIHDHAQPMHPAVLESLEKRRLLATSGLNATFFDNIDFTGATAQRIDRTVNFDFGNHQSPASGIAGTTFSARWNGLVKPGHSETYTFSVRAGDGVRLWINGKLLIDSWKVAARRTLSGSIALRAGHLYDLRLEFFDKTRTAAIRLSWSSPSTPAQTISPKRLFAYDTRFAEIGDFGRTTDFARGTATIVNGWAPDFIVTAGDNNYTSAGYDGNVGTFYHQYIGNYHGAHGAGSATNRFWPALGNHDWDNEKAYEAFFTLPGNERYYDVVQGPVHFFMIDSDKHEPDGTSPSSKQGKWLQGKLAASTSLYNVVIFHHAPFSSGHHANVGYMRWPFKAWGADIVLAGHDHDYERLVEGGLTYVVNGSGAGPRSLGGPIAGSLVRDNSDSGALLVQANDQVMTFQFELRSGKVIDTFSIAPHVT